MKKDIIGLQPIIENTYHNGGGWKSPKLNRYSKHGKGFGEGSALSAVLFKYNLNIDTEKTQTLSLTTLKNYLLFIN